MVVHPKSCSTHWICLITIFMDEKKQQLYNRCPTLPRLQTLHAVHPPPDKFPRKDSQIWTVQDSTRTQRIVHMTLWQRKKLQCKSNLVQQTHLLTSKCGFLITSTLRSGFPTYTLQGTNLHQVSVTSWKEKSGMYFVKRPIYRNLLEQLIEVMIERFHCSTSLVV